MRRPELVDSPAVAPIEPTEAGDELDARARSRRDLMRLLVAGGVGAAAALVSVDWRSPTLRVGILPAHASCSTSDPATNAECQSSVTAGCASTGNVWDGCVGGAPNGKVETKNTNGCSREVTIKTPEECDDGNMVDTDECNNKCKKKVTGSPGGS